MPKRKNDKYEAPWTGEELTEKMHSEFFIDEETERRQKAYIVLSLTGTENWNKIKEWAKFYNVPMADIKEFIEDYKILRDGDAGTA